MVFKKTYWQGRYLLDKIELFSFFLIYTLIICVPLIIGTEAILYVVFFIFLYIVIFIAIQQRILRFMSERYNGMVIMGGWIDEEEGMGEPYEFHIKSFVVLKDLTEKEKGIVELYITHQKTELLEFERAIRLTQNPLDYKYIEKYDEKEAGVVKYIESSYYNKLPEKIDNKKEEGVDNNKNKKK